MALQALSNEMFAAAAADSPFRQTTSVNEAAFNVTIQSFDLHRSDPINTGASVVAVTYRDGVLMATDTLGTTIYASLNSSSFSC